MENKKLTWWQYINQDRGWIVMFIAGFVGFVTVIIADRIDPFRSVWWFLLALAVFFTIMFSIAYTIFYKGWKKYLNDPKS